MTTRAMASYLPRPVGLTRIMLGVLGAWLLLVIGLGASGAIYGIGRGFIPIVWGPTVAFLIAFAFVPRARAWFLRLNPRMLILLHQVRSVGVIFLVLYAQGRLPYAFAGPAAWGDMLMAATAPLAALCVPARTPLRRGLLLGWNLLGLIDVLNAVLTAARLRFRNPAEMAAITAFPYSLIPTFIVPLIMITHVILIAQLWSTHPRRAIR
jgi:hypothetical protein